MDKIELSAHYCRTQIKACKLLQEKKAEISARTNTNDYYNVHTNTL